MRRRHISRHGTVKQGYYLEWGFEERILTFSPPLPFPLPLGGLLRCLRIIFQREIPLNFRTSAPPLTGRTRRSTFHRRARERLYIITRGTSSVMNDIPPSFLKTRRRLVPSRSDHKERKGKRAELNTAAK